MDMGLSYLRIYLLYDSFIFFVEDNASENKSSTNWKTNKKQRERINLIDEIC